MPHSTASLPYISWTVWARITKFYQNIHTDLHYTCAGHDVTIYFRSEATVKIPSKMPPQTASNGIYQEVLKRGSPNFIRLSGTTDFSHKSAWYNVTHYFRSAANAIQYCTKMMRETCPAGQRLKYFGHWLSQTRHMLHGHPCCPSLRPQRIWRHQLLPIGIYRSSKNDRKYCLQPFH